MKEHQYIPLILNYYILVLFHHQIIKIFATDLEGVIQFSFSFVCKNLNYTININKQ